MSYDPSFWLYTTGASQSAPSSVIQYLQSNGILLNRPDSKWVSLLGPEGESLPLQTIPEFINNLDRSDEIIFQLWFADAGWSDLFCQVKKHDAAIEFYFGMNYYSIRYTSQCIRHLMSLARKMMRDRSLLALVIDRTDASSESPETWTDFVLHKGPLPRYNPTGLILNSSLAQRVPRNLPCVSERTEDDYKFIDFGDYPESCHCPVCNYPSLDQPAWDYDSPSFEICPCCGTQFGYDDSTTTHDKLSQNWILSGLKWHGPSSPLKSWNPFKQSLKISDPRESYANKHAEFWLKHYDQKIVTPDEAAFNLLLLPIYGASKYPQDVLDWWDKYVNRLPQPILQTIDRLFQTQWVPENYLHDCSLFFMADTNDPQAVQAKKQQLQPLFKLFHDLVRQKISNPH